MLVVGSRTKFEPCALEHRIRYIFTLVLLGLIGFAVLPVAAEIPCPPDAPTERTFYDAALKFYLHTSVDVYKSSGTTMPSTGTAIQEQVVRFMKGAEENLLGLARAPSPESLVNQGRRLVQAGCDDPLVLYFLGEFLSRQGRMKEAEPFLCEAADNIIPDRYPANWRARAAEEAFMTLKANGKKKKMLKYRDQLAAAVADIFKDHLFADDRALLMRNLFVLTDDLPAGAIQKILAAAKAVPDADPAALDYIQGQWHLQAAWQDRGDDWGDKVTAKGWQGFSDELAQARTALVAAWTLDQKIPEAATAMIHVTMGEGNAKEMRAWFDRAVAARFDDSDAYSAYIWGIYPRWLGDRATLMAFADECAATGRFDTQVPLHYFEILTIVRTECDNNKMVSLTTPDLYEKAHDILEKTLAPEGALSNDRGYRSAEVAYAIAAKRWNDAHQAMDQLEGQKLDATATANFGLTPQRIQAALDAHPSK